LSAKVRRVETELCAVITAVVERWNKGKGKRKTGVEPENLF